MISLRAYNKEIETLIDNGQFDESIAHCQYILSKFPKCIETYRNLGKTLLESKKYTEAFDVFNRVLAAFPDDFISHVGLSIIIEDQKDLDLAIWHMEQAFDVQPSNLAIQDELRRLFGLRDGEKPSKIRLTRGALVRMYARGELFQQAISEIKAILEEDPKRKDLEVILAKMLYFSGSIEESITLCDQILEKTPYCFEVNRIMQEIWTSKNDAEKASTHRNRLVSLDPYYQFSLSAFDEQEIPENKILLEKLAFTPSVSSTFETPAWSDNFDVPSMSSSFENTDWLKNIANQSDTVPVSSPFTAATDISQQSEESEKVKLPDWMENAGWTTASATTPTAFVTDEISNSLKKEEPLSPLISPVESETPPVAEMDHIQPDSEEVDLSQIGQPQFAKNDLASLFSEMKEGRMDNEISNEKNGIDKNSPSDWQSQFSNPESNDQENPQSQDLPDWLNNFNGEDPKTKDDSDDMPDWLKNLQSAVEPISSDTDEARNENPIESPVLENEKSDDLSSDQKNGWQNESTSNFVSSDDIPEEKPEKSEEPASEDTIPAWVASVLMTNEPVANTTSDSSSEADKIVTGGLTPPSDQEEGIISQQTNDELLDWLRGLKTEDQKVQEDLPESIPDDLFTKEKEAISEYESSESDHDYKIKSVDETQRLIDEAIAKAKAKASGDSEVPSAEPPPLTAKELESLSEETTPVSSDEQPISEEIIQTEPVVDTQTSPVETEIASEPEIQQKASSFQELLKKQDYAGLPETFDKMLSDGISFEELINQVTSIKGAHLDSYSYWQNLGDIYSSHEQYNLALQAYQKAEDLLILSISK